MSYTDNRQAGEENEKGVPQIEVTSEMIRMFRDWYNEVTTIGGETDLSDQSIVTLLSTVLCTQVGLNEDRGCGSRRGRSD